MNLMSKSALKLIKVAYWRFLCSLKIGHCDLRMSSESRDWAYKIRDWRFGQTDMINYNGRDL